MKTANNLLRDGFACEPLDILEVAMDLHFLRIEAGRSIGVVEDPIVRSINDFRDQGQIVSSER